MSDIDMFTIDDDFDPLADLNLDDEERDEAEVDYLPPIPDADKSVVPPVVPLSAEERIEKLLAGIPGQQFRILHAVEFCTEPRTMNEIVEDLDVAYPRTTSVYGAAQIVQLLERDGALERLACEEGGQEAEAFASDEAGAPAVPDGAEAHESLEEPAVFEISAVREAPEASETPASETSPSQLEGDFIAVTPVPPCRYRATRTGLDAVAAHVNEGLVVQKITEDERYLPLFQRVLEMTAREGGCPTKELDQAVDPDPLCAEPRRFCGFFRGKLEETGAIEWRGTWAITALGRTVLESGLFTK